MTAKERIDLIVEGLSVGDLGMAEALRVKFFTLRGNGLKAWMSFVDDVDAEAKREVDSFLSDLKTYADGGGHTPSFAEAEGMRIYHQQNDVRKARINTAHMEGDKS